MPTTHPKDLKSCRPTCSNFMNFFPIHTHPHLFRICAKRPFFQVFHDFQVGSHLSGFSWTGNAARTPGTARIRHEMWRKPVCLKSRTHDLFCQYACVRDGVTASWDPVSIIYAQARGMWPAKCIRIIWNLYAEEAIYLSVYCDWLSIIYAHARVHMQMAWEEAKSISILLILDTNISPHTVTF